MSRLSENARLLLGTLIGISGGTIIAVLVINGLFHQPFQWAVVWSGIAGGVGAVLGMMTRTHPRLRVALRAGIWAVLAAGVTWIITAFINLTFAGPWLRAETLIPPLIAALLTGGGFYWWYQRHSPATAAAPRDAQR